MLLLSLPEPEPECECAGLVLAPAHEVRVHDSVPEPGSGRSVWLSGSSAGGRPNAQVLRNGDALWWSERSGHGHLYRVDGTSGEVTALTSGSWVVDEIVGLDEDAAEVSCRPCCV